MARLSYSANMAMRTIETECADGVNMFMWKLCSHGKSGHLQNKNNALAMFFLLGMLMERRKQVTLHAEAKKRRSVCMQRGGTQVMACVQ